MWFDLYLHTGDEARRYRGAADPHQYEKALRTRSLTGGELFVKCHWASASKTFMWQSLLIEKKEIHKLMGMPWICRDPLNKKNGQQTLLLLRAHPPNVCGLTYPHIIYNIAIWLLFWSDWVQTNKSNVSHNLKTPYFTNVDGCCERNGRYTGFCQI